MKIVFVQSLPVMLESYLILSACLKKKGFQTEVFIESFECDLTEQIINSDPGIICFNCLTGSYGWALGIAKKIKRKRNIPVIFGGCHPTYYPGTIDFSIVDYICVGEGEYALVELAEEIKKGRSPGNIKNIGLLEEGRIKINALRPIIYDLATLPFSDRELYHKYKYFFSCTEYDYRTARGCPYNCSFCFMSNLSELYRGEEIFREYPVDFIINEMLNIKHDYRKLRRFSFGDDVFGVDKKWSAKLLLQYKEKVDLPYVITTSANLINDDFISLLKDTNCELLSMSVETANEGLREKVLNKKISNKHLIDIGRKLNKAGIKTRINCIFCIPGEDINDAFSNVKLMKDMRASDPVGFLLQPFPNTKVWDYAVKEGYLRKDMSLDELDPLVYFRTPINAPQKGKIIIVQRLFLYACKVPFFDKLLRLLVNIPNNFVFEFLHKLGIAFSHKNFYRLSFRGLVKYIISANNLANGNNKRTRFSCEALNN